MPVVLIELEQDVLDPSEYQKQLLIPALHAILTSRDGYADRLSKHWQTLLDMGFADQGRLITTPTMLMEALTHVPFNEEVNRAGNI